MEEEIESSQSETWDSVIDEIENAPGVIVNCVKNDTVVPFPKNPGWKVYTIISRTGKKHTAKVDISNKNMEWKLVGKDDIGNLQQSYIVAWRRI